MTVVGGFAVVPQASFAGCGRGGNVLDPFGFVDRLQLTIAKGEVLETGRIEFVRGGNVDPFVGDVTVNIVCPIRELTLTALASCKVDGEDLRAVVRVKEPAIVGKLGNGEVITGRASRQSEFPHGRIVRFG